MRRGQTLYVSVRGDDVITTVGPPTRGPSPQIRSLRYYARKASARVFELFGPRCVYCGDEDGPFEVDHVVPLKWGGTSEESNLVVACQLCNHDKGSQLVEVFLGC